MFKNFVFDFDGTIVDSGEAIYKNLIDSLKIQAPPFRELRKYSAHQLMSSSEFQISKLEIPKLILKVRSDYKKFLPTLALIEDMSETLLSLHKRGGRLFLCTSNTTENVNKFLEIHKLTHAFETVVGTMSIFGKSHGIKKTLKKFKLQPHETIYIGDETRDIQAAKKAGIACASVSWGFNDRALLEEYKPDFLFDQAKELLSLMKP